MVRGSTIWSGAIERAEGPYVLTGIKFHELKSFYSGYGISMTEFPTGTQRSSYTEGWYVAYSSLNSEIIQTFESSSNPLKNRKI